MAEFDKSCFSAVQAYFGNDNDDEYGDVDNDVDDVLSKKQHEQDSQEKIFLPNNNKNNNSITSNKNTKRRGRQGVGVVVVKTDTSNQNPNELSKKILRLGTKRSRDAASNHDDEDDDDDNMTAVKVVNDNSGMYNSSDEDDVGRTNIVSKVQAQSNNFNNDKNNNNFDKVQSKPNQNKKQKNQEFQSLQNDNVQNGNEDKNDNNNINNNNQNERTKRKRRKVRSRQKNIRKDNRVNKPTHLIVGATKNNDYRGRSLTPQTREKLNLPPPKVRHIIKYQNNTTKGGMEQSKLGIDDLLGNVEDEATKTTKEALQNKTKTLKPKKKKSSKYKNLR